MNINNPIHPNDLKEFIVYAAAGLLIAGLLIATSGCSGVELGGRLGVYRVDERQESQRTYRQAVPLRCYFTSCAAAATDEPQGS